MLIHSQYASINQNYPLSFLPVYDYRGVYLGEQVRLCLSGWVCFSRFLKMTCPETLGLSWTQKIHWFSICSVLFLIVKMDVKIPMLNPEARSVTDYIYINRRQWKLSIYVCIHIHLGAFMCTYTHKHIHIFHFHCHLQNSKTK